MRTVFAAARAAGAALGLAFALVAGASPGGALAAPGTAQDGPDGPGREMGGTDSKPTTFDIGGTPDAAAKPAPPLPAPGKAAGTTSPNAPPPPSR